MRKGSEMYLLLNEEQVEEAVISTLQYNLRLELRFDRNKKLMKAYLKVLKDIMPKDSYEAYEDYFQKEYNNEDPF